ncbi:sushi domain (scr repeat) domain protein, partial [Toxoplasma gondii CAST]
MGVSFHLFWFLLSWACLCVGQRRRLSALSASSSRSLSASSSSSFRPLFLDYGVAWSTPNLPFSSRFTEETPALFLNSLYSQFLERHLAVVDPQTGTLHSAAAAMRQRPFLVTFEAPTPLRLSLRFWDRGFGAVSPPEVARGLFVLAGLPLPTAQEIRFGLQTPERARAPREETPARSVSTGAWMPPTGGEAKLSPHAEVQYDFTNEKKTLVPLQPGLARLLGACATSEAQADAKNCCGFHAEMQARTNNCTLCRQQRSVH